jgi:hypothetical protein
MGNHGQGLAVSTLVREVHGAAGEASGGRASPDHGQAGWLAFMEDYLAEGGSSLEDAA